MILFSFYTPAGKQFAMPFFTFLYLLSSRSRIAANKKAVLRGCCSAEDGLNPVVPPLFAVRLREKASLRYAVISPALYRARPSLPTTFASASRSGRNSPLPLLPLRTKPRLSEKSMLSG